MQSVQYKPQIQCMQRTEKQQQSAICEMHIAHTVRTVYDMNNASNVEKMYNDTKDVHMPTVHTEQAS